MSTRKEHIERILESIHIIKRTLWQLHSKKGSSFGMDTALASMTPAQWSALTVIMKGKVRMKDVADTLGTTSSAATQLVDGLVKKGYVMREENPDDRRTIRLTLSPKATKDMERMKHAVTRQLLHFFDILDDTELATYAALNKKIADTLLRQ